VVNAVDGRIGDWSCLPWCRSGRDESRAQGRVAGADVEVAARAGTGAGAEAGALEVVIFRAREGAGGHQMRGGRGPSSPFWHCGSDRAEL